MNHSQPQSQRRTGRNNGDFKQYLVFEKKFGYLHAFREIPNSQPKVYTAKISVPQGQGDRIQYVNFELYVKSAEALSLFLDNRDVIDDDQAKVTVRFSCSFVQPKAYIAQSGQREGEIVPYFSGNLSYLYSMKINGEQVFGYRPMAQAANDSPHDASLTYPNAHIDEDTGEILPTTSEASPPPHDSVPAEAYEDEIVLQQGDRDVHGVMDDDHGWNMSETDLPDSRSQGKKPLAGKKARGTRQAQAKGKASASLSTTAN